MKTVMVGVLAVVLSFTGPMLSYGDGDMATITKYAVREGVNIYAEPKEGAEVLDTTLENTSFEVVEGAEGGGWSQIVSNNGYVFVKTEELSDTPVMPYSDDDLYVLAHVICGEAQCYSDEEQLYVGSVVLNRVSRPDYPNTIRDVVYQKGQYACIHDGNYDRAPTERNWANARYLLEHGSVLPENVVYQSGGKQGKGVYVKTSRHYYCYK